MCCVFFCFFWHFFICNCKTTEVCVLIIPWISLWPLTFLCPVQSPAARGEAGQLLHAWQLSDAAQCGQWVQRQTTALLCPKSGQQWDVWHRCQHQSLQWGLIHLSTSTASQKYRYLLLNFYSPVRAINVESISSAGWNSFINWNRHSCVGHVVA